MCLVSPAQVISVRGTTATVEVDGRTRLASIDVAPDVAVGDWVIVAGGLILRRVTPAIAREMEAAAATAYGLPVTNRRTKGRDRP